MDGTPQLCLLGALAPLTPPPQYTSALNTKPHHHALHSDLASLHAKDTTRSITTEERPHDCRVGAALVETHLSPSIHVVMSL